MCSSDDYGRAEFSNSIARKARKAHRCHECQRMISPGEKYTSTVSLYEGLIDRHKTCDFCDRLIEAHWAAELAMGGSGSYELGGIAEQILECTREEPEYIALFRRAWRGEKLPRFDHYAAARARRDAWVMGARL